MKYLTLALLCFTLAGCANTSNGGGWVVGNGMTDSGTASEGMHSLGSSDEGTAIVVPKADCGCDKNDKGCDCSIVQPKKKRKH